MSKRIVLAILVVLFVTGFSVINIIMNANKIESSPIWNGISPGLTTNVEVEHILGTPTNTFYDNGETIYIYEKSINIGWEKVEILFSQTDMTVQGILLLYPIGDEWKKFGLSSLLDNYGKPNFISWTSTAYFRFIAWTKRGLSVECGTYPLLHEKDIEYDKLKINGVFLFQSMTRSEFKTKHWNFPVFFGWSSENYSSSKYTDAPDVQPKNPFGWILFP